MCGKCGSIKGKVACVSGCLGTLFLLLAGVSRLFHFTPMELGPRSFAGASGLLFLMSISLHTCKHTCDTDSHQ